MDIQLFVDSKYAGFFPLDTIEERIEEARLLAEQALPDMEWDEVLLYAILDYDEETQALISADVMNLRIPRYEYAKLCRKLSKSCRLFTLRKR